LAVAATTAYVLCIQLGDGDILFVDSQGDTHRPLPKDDKTPKQTGSLWRGSAGAELRVHVHDGSQQIMPALILTATDGYASCYESDHEFLQIGRHYMSMLSTEGIDNVDDLLQSCLREASWR